MSGFITDLQRQITGSVLPMESLKRHTTWRIGGPAEVLVIPENRQDVLNSLAVARRWEKDITVIGNGSNLLIADSGLKGLVLKLAGGLTNWRVENQQVRAESGCLLPGLARKTADLGLAGLEFAAGIPASLGGALVMNAGAHGGELGALVEEVVICDFAGNVIRRRGTECCFAYRTSAFQQGKQVILEACLKLQPGDRDASQRLIQANLAKRKEAQPLEYPNCGSVFRNLPSAPAGRLIEEAGAKGLRIGGAMVSEKHANFIVNLGDATAEDVLALIDKVQAMVFAKFQVELHPEVKILGNSRE